MRQLKSILLPIEFQPANNAAAQVAAGVGRASVPESRVARRGRRSALGRPIAAPARKRSQAAPTVQGRGWPEVHRRRRPRGSRPTGREHFENGRVDRRGPHSLRRGRALPAVTDRNRSGWSRQFHTLSDSRGRWRGVLTKRIWLSYVYSVPWTARRRRGAARAMPTRLAQVHSARGLRGDGDP